MTATTRSLDYRDEVAPRSPVSDAFALGTPKSNIASVVLCTCSYGGSSYSQDGHDATENHDDE